jgi:hypothetical protein
MMPVAIETLGSGSEPYTGVARLFLAAPRRRRRSGRATPTRDGDDQRQAGCPKNTHDSTTKPSIAKGDGADSAVGRSNEQPRTQRKSLAPATAPSSVFDVSRVSAWFFVLACLGCAPERVVTPKPNAAPPQPSAAPQNALPVYRFVPVPRTGPMTQVLDAEHIAGLESEDRVVVGPDGSMERAATPPGEALMGGVRVPDHLGGGYLFWSRQGLYHAPTFAGPLAPVARIPTNVVGVEFGPSSILLFTPSGPPHAFALEPGRPVPLSPHGVLEIAAADAEHALAFDAAGRYLATTDGGRSWTDVRAKLGAAASGLRTEGNEVAFVLGRTDGAWLQKDGSFVRRPLPTKSGPPPEVKALALLKRAVSGGLLLSSTHALAVDEAGAWDVNLESGQAAAIAPKLPYGSSCLPLTSAEQGIFLCFSYAVRGNKMALVARALTDHPQVEKEFQGPPPFALSYGELVVGASCSGLPVDGVACVRSFAGTANQRASWGEVNIQKALGATWRPLSWIPKAKGGVAALVSDQKPGGPSPKLALVDAESGALIPFDAPLDRVAPHGFGRDLTRNFLVLENGELRGFTSTSGLAVDAKGHVSLPARNFKNVVNAGAFALAESDDLRLWQTTDYGEHWVEIARPPFEPQMPPPPSSPEFPSMPRSISCSLVGCVLAHESGLGSWLRHGWPADPPRARDAAQGSKAVAPEPVSPLAPPPPRTTTPRPNLRCVAPSASKPGGRPKLSARTPRATAPSSRHATTTDATATSGKHPAPAPPAIIDYRDIFAPAALQSYGLRATFLVKTGNGAELHRDLDGFVMTKAPFEVELVQPFDTAGRTLRATGSLDLWTSLVKTSRPSPGGRPLTFEPNEGGTRPVLSAAPARTDGALLVNEDFSFWLSRAGKIRPIKPGCRPDAGYVDEHGTLFVACGDWSGSTAILDVDHDRPVLRLPPAQRFRDESHPGMHFFPPGATLLTNPDAIAVAPDKKLAIVRLGSGNEPSTTDSPAWLLRADEPPVELAPWASLEPATSPACAKGDGYRALIQTSVPWLEVEGATLSHFTPGMSAIVRWSAERVCLEAVEIGLRDEPDGAQPADPTLEPRTPIRVLVVGRFAGKDAGSAFVGTGTTSGVLEPVKCELVPSGG